MSGAELIRGLLEECVRTGSSDLHLSAAAPPFFRLHGKLNTFDHAVLSAEDVEGVARALMNARQQAVYDEEHTFDLAHSLSDHERFRVNIFRERARTALSIRRLEQKFKTLDQWNLPPQLGELAELRDGLVLVTGPTGSGKTTTLATLIHQINLTRSCHIITVEDPVEYIHRNEKSLVRQRELYNDVPSFADAVRAAMRE
ncbi:MAG: type IV pilus twitching motility protein PilT, partial [Gemmataceae bacterium]